MNPATSPTPACTTPPLRLSPSARRFQAQERCLRRWLAKGLRVSVGVGVTLAWIGFALLLVNWPKAPLFAQGAMIQLGQSSRGGSGFTGGWAWVGQPFWRADTLSLWGVSALICSIVPLFVMLTGHFLKCRDFVAATLTAFQISVFATAIWLAGQ